MKRVAVYRFLHNLFQNWLVCLVTILILGALAGVAAMRVVPLLDQFWWLVLLFVVGLTILPVVVRQPTRWLFTILVLALPFSARFRLFSQGLHSGGAEAALAPVDFVLLALFLLYVVEDLRQGKLIFYGGSVERGLLLFGFAGLLTVFNAAEPAYVLYEVIRVLRMLALVYCIRRFVRGPAELRLVIYLLAFNVVTQGLLGLAELALGRSVGLYFLGEADALWLDISIEGGLSRVGGTLGHANSMAMFLEMLLPLFFSLSVARNTGLSSRQRLLSMSVFALGLAVLLMTFSRSGWIALFVALVLVLLYHFRHLRLSTRQLGILITAGFASLAAVIVFWEPIYRRLTTSSSVSFSFRASLNAIAMNMVEAHPWLGVGLNNFVFVIAKYDDVGVTPRHISPAHNIYFLTAAETGILGLLAFLLLLVGIFVGSWQGLKSKDSFVAACAAGLLAGLAAALVHSNLGWLWRYDVVHVTFWFVVGFALSVAHLPERLPTNQGQPAQAFGHRPQPADLGSPG